MTLKSFHAQKTLAGAAGAAPRRGRGQNGWPGRRPRRGRGQNILPGRRPRRGRGQNILPGRRPRRGRGKNFGRGKRPRRGKPRPTADTEYIPCNVSNNDFKTILLMLWHQSVDMRSRFVFDPTLHVGLPVDVQLLQMYKYGIFAEKSLLGFRGCSNTT